MGHFREFSDSLYPPPTEHLADLTSASTMQFLNLFTRFFVLFLFTLFLSTPFTFAAPLQHPRGRKGPDARLPGNLFSITQDCHTGERHPELSHCPDIGAYYFREDVSTTCPFMPKAMISSLDIGADGAFMALALLNNHGRGLKFPLLLFKQLFGTIDTLKVMEVYGETIRLSNLCKMLTLTQQRASKASNISPALLPRRPPTLL